MIWAKALRFIFRCNASSLEIDLGIGCTICSLGVWSEAYRAGVWSLGFRITAAKYLECSCCLSEEENEVRNKGLRGPQR